MIKIQWLKSVKLLKVFTVYRCSSQRLSFHLIPPFVAVFQQSLFTIINIIDNDNRKCQTLVALIRVK